MKNKSEIPAGPADSRTSSQILAPKSEVPPEPSHSMGHCQFQTLTLKLPLLVALLAMSGGLTVRGLPVVSNYTTCIYAVVPDPLALSFAGDGTLYAARDNSGSGGGSGDAVKIHRVDPGGTAVTEFGDTTIRDPDALVVDVAGSVSGIPGSVLVGGTVAAGQGQIARIAPDGSVSLLFGPSADYVNPSCLSFDGPDRLLFTSYDEGRVLESSGGAPALLLTLGHAYGIEVDAAGRLVISTGDDTWLHLYTSSGAVSNTQFASVKSRTPLARGPGGNWGTDIYAVGKNGELLRVDLNGATMQLGSGFADISDLKFGPDGALYASQFSGDCIYRIAPPTVPGAETAIYAHVTDPVRLAFAPDGRLFVGRDNAGSGGGDADAVRIHRVGPGGSPVGEYGEASITDPDGVAYDVNGSSSGIPGAVIVGGKELGGGRGKIVAIRPDQTITTLYGPTTSAFNPNVFAHDLNGRLLFSDDDGGRVWTMTNGTPTVLFTLALPWYLTADSLNRIVVGVHGAQPLRLYSSGGGLLTNAFATVGMNSPLARGPGGFWGTGVFCVNPNGDLLSLDTNGVSTKWGAGFSVQWDMAFGPDGALYVGDYPNDLIWRVSPTPARPRLTATLISPQEIRLSWSPPVPGFALQQALVLSPGAWTDSPSGTTNPVVVPATEAGKLYRLRKP